MFCLWQVWNEFIWISLTSGDIVNHRLVSRREGTRGSSRLKHILNYTTDWIVCIHHISVVYQYARLSDTWLSGLFTRLFGPVNHLRYRLFRLIKANWWKTLISIAKKDLVCSLKWIIFMFSPWGKNHALSAEIGFPLMIFDIGV